MKNTEEANI